MKKTILLIFVLALVYVGIINAGITDRFISDFANPYTLTQSIPSLINNISVFNSTWLEFDGVDDWILADDKGDSFGKTVCNNGCTFCSWVKPNDDNREKMIFGRADATDTRNYFKVSVKNDLDFTFNLFNGNDPDNTFARSAPISTGWNFLCARYNGGIDINNSLEVLVDTSIIDVSNVNITINESEWIEDESVLIGTHDDNSRTSFFNGSLDDIRIYNISLIQGQIIRLFKENNKGSNYGRGIVGLGYHSITDPASTSSTNLGNFTQQMKYLNDSGFETITFNDFLDFRNNGNFTMPEKPIIIEFDDGTLSDIEVAKPIMDLYGFVGVSSIVTDWVNNSGRMSWENLTTLINAGWEIGSHSVNHSHMRTLSQEDRIQQFNLSKIYLENNLSITVNHFRYPFLENNNTLDDECSQFYEICDGDRDLATQTLFYTYVNGNLTHESEDSHSSQVNMRNDTLFSDFITAVDYTLGLVLQQNFNENNGSTTYDTSENNNNGTITGATWNNDENKIILNNIFDYSLNLNQFTLLDQFYNRMWMEADFDCTDPYNNIINLTMNICTNLKPFNYTGTSTFMSITNVNDSQFTLNLTELEAPNNDIKNGTSGLILARNQSNFTITLGPNDEVQVGDFTLTITNIVVSSIKDTTAAISWTTSELSNTTINYGTASGSPNLISQTDDSVTSHSRSLDSLDIVTRYFFTVTSCDISGSCVTSSESSFTTKAISGRTSNLLRNGVAVLLALAILSVFALPLLTKTDISIQLLITLLLVFIIGMVGVTFIFNIT